MSDEDTWEFRSKPPKELKVALGLLSERRDDEALLELKEVVSNGPRRGARKPLPRDVQIARLYKDQFSCAHCGKSLVPDAILRALSLFFPDEFPVQRGWTAGQSHPVYLQFAATFDRVNPNAIGGQDRFENLLTSCWACNASEGPFLLERDEPRRTPPRHPKWHGLVPQYLELGDRLQERSTEQWNRLHRLWQRDLAAAESSQMAS